MALLTCALLACGCGSSQPSGTGAVRASASTRQAAASPQPSSPLRYGRPASRQEAKAIAALVRGYWQAAAADDGVRLCSLLYSLFAEDVPEDYGRPPGPPALRGNSCPVVLGKLFRGRRRLQREELARLRVSGARVSYLSGLALLSFGGVAPPSFIPVKRERGTWKIDGLVDSPT